MSLVKHFRELDIYQNTLNLAMKVFEAWRTFQQIDSGYEKGLGQIVKMANQPVKWLIHGNEPECRRMGVPENRPPRAPKPPLPRYSNTPSHAL